jgi:hypothetical protein
MLIGDTNFSIESYISSAYSNRGILGIGYFIVHLKGVTFGVKEDDATCLACSFDAVNDRIANKGKHIGPHDFILGDALFVANFVRQSLFAKENTIDYKSDILNKQMARIINKNQLLWAPDGDAAFDDRSNILQFDIGKQVRLIGYKCICGNEIDVDSIRDLYLDADCYYNILKKWSEEFINEWNTMDKKI